MSKPEHKVGEFHPANRLNRDHRAIGFLFGERACTGNTDAVPLITSTCLGPELVGQKLVFDCELGR